MQRPAAARAEACTCDRRSRQTHLHVGRRPRPTQRLVPLALHLEVLDPRWQACVVKLVSRSPTRAATRVRLAPRPRRSARAAPPHTDTHTERQTDRQTATDRQTDSQPASQRASQPASQPARQKHTHTHTPKHTHTNTQARTPAHLFFQGLALWAVLAIFLCAGCGGGGASATRRQAAARARLGARARGRTEAEEVGVAVVVALHARGSLHVGRLLLAKRPPSAHRTDSHWGLQATVGCAAVCLLHCSGLSTWSRVIFSFGGKSWHEPNLFEQPHPPLGMMLA